MLRPLVAVTSRHLANGDSVITEGYIQALEAVGLLPVVVAPSLSAAASCELLGAVSGLMLSGGDDLSPLSFGQQPQPNLGVIEPQRDEQELPMVQKAWALGLPMLGICRGMQAINAALGGTIIQHLGEQGEGAIQHRQQAPRWHKHHQVEVQPGTILAGAMGDGLLAVNSYHHQALDQVAPELVVSATAPDGVIEAVESASPWVLAVQWHPEEMWKKHPEFLALFAAFARACGVRQQ